MRTASVLRSILPAVPRCPGCGADHEAVDLVRDERETAVVVHCPNCNQLLGRYRVP
jgi:uncharacterized Zn finger protein